jgi:hypothetical protein
MSDTARLADVICDNKIHISGWVYGDAKEVPSPRPRVYLTTVGGVILAVIDLSLRYYPLYSWRLHAFYLRGDKEITLLETGIADTLEEATSKVEGFLRAFPDVFVL